MGRYKPLGAVRGKDGVIRFHPSARGEQIALPCGKCIGCKLEYSRQWALRCVHESKQHVENSWFTITYDDEHLPYGGSLVPEHLQKFMKRLRRGIGDKEIRFYACGEYGETRTKRPHYHVCCFGFDFDDKLLRGQSEGGFDVYSSEFLDERWGFGRTEIGELTFETAAYTARYCTKKITGEKAVGHYTRILEDGRMVEVEPEFALMSLKPGIGAAHYEEYREEIVGFDTCVINGMESKPPRYYDKLLEREDPKAYEAVKRRRRSAALEGEKDQTLERRTVREKVKKAQVGRLKKVI